MRKLLRKLFLFFIFITPLVVNALDYEKGDHELHVMPTAYILDEGGSYLTLYQLVLLNYGRVIGRNTQVGVVMIYPVFSFALETTTFGIKHNYKRKQYWESALFSVYNPKTSTVIAGNVLSLGTDRGRSLHLGLGHAYGTEAEANDGILMVGGRFDLSEDVSFVSEYTNTASGLKGDFDGLFTMALRLKTSKMIWELGGIRLVDSSSSLLSLPTIKATYYF